jgi:hypothetical protein
MAELELGNITKWMHANLLTVNLSKTNYTIFSPTLKPLDINIVNSIVVDQHKIVRVRSIKYLGVVIDDGLTWLDHIKYVCTKIRRFCGIFYKIRSVMPSYCRRLLYFSLVHSHLQYAIEIYANTNQSQLHDLKVVNNRILRALQDCNIRTKIFDMFRPYNTLPVSSLHDYKLGLFVYKFLYHRDKLPISFQHYFKQNFLVHNHNTRMSFNIHIARFQKRFGKRSLVYRAAVVWNNLPPDLKCSPSISTFKKRLLLYFLNKEQQ